MSVDLDVLISLGLELLQEGLYLALQVMFLLAVALGFWNKGFLLVLKYSR